MDLPLPQFARDPVDFLFPPLPAACTHIGFYFSLTLSADPPCTLEITRDSPARHRLRRRQLRPQR